MIKEKLKKSWEWVKRNVKKVLIGIGIVGVATAITIPLIPDRVPDIALEKMTEKYNQAQEIRAKYQMKGASLKRIAKDDPKDRIEVYVGNREGEEFIPRVEIQRWDNEVNFSVELKDTETGNPTLNFEGEKIKWSKGNIDIEYYDYESGYKMVWFLKEKPLTNKVEFTLQSKDAVFYYQPELTQDEKDNGAFRPDNVVGSYAVYAETPKTNWVGGKLYRVGKVGHIYRPRLKDSNGWEVWGNLHIENGVYEVEIPQNFIDKAVYPIRSNDTFGYEGTGDFEDFVSDNYVHVSFPHAPAGGNGTVSKLTAHIKNYASGDVAKARAVIYLDSDDTLIAAGSEVSLPNDIGWVDLPVTGDVVDATDYILGVWIGTYDGRFSEDRIGGAGHTKGRDNETYHATNDPTSPFVYQDGQVDWRYSIYATYTPEAPPAAEEEGQTMIIEQD